MLTPAETVKAVRAKLYSSLSWRGGAIDIGTIAAVTFKVLHEDLGREPQHQEVWAIVKKVMVSEAIDP